MMSLYRSVLREVEEVCHMGYPVWRVVLLLVLSAVLAGHVSAACKAELGVLERPVVVAGHTWPAVVDELARQLEVGIVAFVPASYVSRTWKGPAAQVLAQIAAQVQGVWHVEKELLLLRPAWERLPSRPVTPQEVAQGREHLIFDVERFFQVLEPEQRQRLGSAEGLSVRALTKAQQKILQKVGRNQSVPEELFLREGKVYSWLELGKSGQVLWRGLDVHLLLEGWIEKWPGDIYLRTSRAVSARVPGPLVEQARRLFAEQKWLLPRTTVYALSALQKHLSAWRRVKGEVIVSAQVRGQQVVVSSGSWQVPQLLGAVAWVQGLEWRELEDLVFLGPMREVLSLQTQAEEAHACDVSWALWEPLRRLLESNPRNQVASPFKGLSVWRPHLLAWKELSPAQQEYAKQQFLGLGSKLIPEVLRKRWLAPLEGHPEEVELYLYPVLVLELDWPGRDAPRTPGFGPTSTYGWLVTRFGRQGQLSAGTPPEPRGEQK
jgi:hypothetical protein